MSDERDLEEILKRIGGDRALNRLDEMFGKKHQPEPKVSSNTSTPDDSVDPLGTQRVIADLNQKYGRASVPKPQQEVPDDLSGADRMWAEIEERNRKYAARIEGAREKQEVYSARELNELFALRQQLLQMSKFNAQSRLPDIEKILDSKRLWAYKFSTQPGSGEIKDLATSLQDSLYYVTPSGLSLRVKRVLAYEPRADEPLIYPVFEKAVFRKDGGKDYLTAPQLAMWAGEFASGDFLKIQKNNQILLKDYHSKLRFYEKNNKIVGVTSEVKEDPFHNGDRVNRIYNL